MNQISRYLQLVRVRCAYSTRIQFSALEFFFWAACSAYYPYLVVFLRARSFSNTTIGTILAVNSAIVIMAQPFWGYVSDLVQSVKKIFIICISIASLLLIAVPFFQHTLMIALIIALVTFFESPLQSLLDSWVVRGIKQEQQTSYGSIRLWGSIGFALTALLAGYFVDIWGVNRVFAFYALFAILVILICARQRDEAPRSKSVYKDLRPVQLLKNRPYVFFVLIITIMFVPLRSSMIFLPNLMEVLGGTNRQYGMLFFVSALSEVPVFIFSGRLVVRFKPQVLIACSLFFLVIRQFLFIVVTSPWQLILIQCVQGLSFGLFLTGTVYYVYEIAPDNLKATAQTMATSMFFGLSGVLGSYLGGLVIDKYGLVFMYQAGFVISLIVALLFVVQTIVDSRQARLHT